MAREVYASWCLPNLVPVQPKAEAGSDPWYSVWSDSELGSLLFSSSPWSLSWSRSPCFPVCQREKPRLGSSSYFPMMPHTMRGLQGFLEAPSLISEPAQMEMNLAPHIPTKGL
jgi:hypothetical protein